MLPYCGRTLLEGLLRDLQVAHVAHVAHAALTHERWQDGGTSMCS